MGLDAANNLQYKILTEMFLKKGVWVESKVV
jgi:hypothetical protein